MATKSFRDQIRVANKPVSMSWQCTHFCRVVDIWGKRVASILPPQPQSRHLGLVRWRLLLNELMRKASHILEGAVVSTTMAKEPCSPTGCVIVHNGCCIQFIWFKMVWTQFYTLLLHWQASLASCRGRGNGTHLVLCGPIATSENGVIAAWADLFPNHEAGK